MKNGVGLMARHARIAAKVQGVKLAALARHYVEDHALIGGERMAPLSEI